MAKMLEYKRIILYLIWHAFLVLALVVQSPAISLSEELPRRKIVVIDPGHGGDDMGAVGPSGLAEKVVALSVANMIKKILSETHEVHLTRNDDYAVDIEDRAAMANHYRADIFLSIHAGGGFSHQDRGIVILYHSPDTGTGGLSSKERAGSWETGANPVPWDSMHTLYTAKSKVLAETIRRHLLAKINPVDKGVHKAPCLILKGVDMPAVLVEVGHLNHPGEENDLRNPEVISAAARAICEAIKEFFVKYP